MNELRVTFGFAVGKNRSEQWIEVDGFRLTTHDLSFPIHEIESLMNDAYEAGKNGRSIVFESTDNEDAEEGYVAAKTN